MKALLLSSYGDPENVLRLADVEDPKPANNQVRVRVHATAINDWDWGLIRGKPPYIRLFMGMSRPKVRIPGVDVAGTVDAVGPGVTRFQVGDSVYGDLSECGFGAFAEQVCAPESELHTIPNGMSFEQAACVPHAAMLAVQALAQWDPVAEPPYRVLVNGAGGGVGMFAPALLHSSHVHLTGVDTADKFDTMKQFGYDDVIDYRAVDFATTGQRYDLILDTKTTRSPRVHLRALRPRGMYTTVGGSSANLLQTAVARLLIEPITRKKLRVLALKPNRGMERVNKLWDQGHIHLTVDGPYPFAEIVAAIRHFGAGSHRGKVVVTVAPA